MAQVDETDQKIYFGNTRWGDFTTHKDEKKRKRWLARNKVEPWRPTLTLNLTPQWLNRHLLWEKDDMNASMAAASVMYHDIRFRWGMKKRPPSPVRAAPPSPLPPGSPPPNARQSPPRSEPPTPPRGPGSSARPPPRRSASHATTVRGSSSSASRSASRSPSGPLPPIQLRRATMVDLNEPTLEGAKRDFARVRTRLRAARVAGNVALIVRLQQEERVVRAWIQRAEGGRR